METLHELRVSLCREQGSGVYLPNHLEERVPRVRDVGSYPTNVITVTGILRELSLR